MMSAASTITYLPVPVGLDKKNKTIFTHFPNRNIRVRLFKDVGHRLGTKNTILRNADFLNTFHALLSSTTCQSEGRNELQQNPNHREDEKRHHSSIFIILETKTP